MKSPPVCHPLHLLDCCPQTDGAAAVLLVNAERAARVHRQAGVRRRVRRRDRPPVPAREGQLHRDQGHAHGVAARVRDGGRRPERHRLRRGARLLHDHRDPRHRRPRLLRKGRRRPGQPRGRDRADRAASRSTRAAACSPRATRSARPASPRSPSAGGNCAARPAIARSRPATATRCSTTPADAAPGVAVVNILTNRNDAS